MLEYGKAHELFQQALAQEQSPERQASLLKASGDALILQGRAVEAGRAYAQALVLLPESLETTVVGALLFQNSDRTALHVCCTISACDSHLIMYHACKLLRFTTKGLQRFERTCDHCFICPEVLQWQHVSHSPHA